jgi:hypothetical protein
MNAPRDHHFIPAFYLGQWASRDNELVEYTIKHGKLIPKPVGPKATGFERDLYAFPELPPEHAQHLESVFFNYADNTAAQALALHLTANAAGWNSELVSAWSRFTIGVHLRHPDVMPELREASGTIWDMSGPAYQAHYEEIRTPQHPATMDEWIATLDPLTRSKVQLNCIIKILDNEIVGTHLNAMKWAVVDASQSSDRFLTSDRPVEISKLNDPGGFVSMPISPTKLFVAANREQSIENLRRIKPREIARHINTFIVSRARKFVWASDESQARFIENHMSKAMEPTPFFPNLSRYETPQTAA